MNNRNGDLGTAVADLIHVVKSAAAVPSRTTARRGEPSPQLAALAAAVLGVGVRHWVNHRNDGCAFCAGAGLGGGRRPVALVEPQLYGHTHRRPKRRRWVRRSVVAAATAVAYSKVRRVLDESRPSESEKRN